MTVAELNNLPQPKLQEELRKCCGASAWVEKMSAAFPVESKEELLRQAEETWYSCTENDWREAFTHHPKIGDAKALKEKFASTSHWTAGEQAGVKCTTDEVLQALAEGNRQYEEKFGYIFIVCATGKSAEEMLSLLKARLPNPPEEELKMAMGEQNKITKIRLEKLLAA